MGDLIRKWAQYANAPTDIKSRSNGDCGLKCPHCGNTDSNKFMKPMYQDPVCLSCNKTIQ